MPKKKTYRGVTAKLTQFVNKRFSAKFGDGKFKENLDKYGRPSNCDKVAVPTVNPEIWDKLTHQALLSFRKESQKFELF